MKNFNIQEPSLDGASDPWYKKLVAIGNASNRFGLLYREGMVSVFTLPAQAVFSAAEVITHLSGLKDGPVVQSAYAKEKKITGFDMSEGCRQLVSRTTWSLLSKDFEVLVTVDYRNERLVRKIFPTGQSIFFVQNQYGPNWVTSFDSFFFSLLEYENEKAFLKFWADFIWDGVGDAMEISAEATSNGPVTKLVKAEWREGHYVGEQSAEGILREWRVARSLGKQRSYLMLGPPGTGKTTVAHKVAKQSGGRVLRLSPQALLVDNAMSAEVMHLLLSLLNPTVFLVEDLHLVPDRLQHTLLHAFENLSNFSLNKSTMLIATANNLKKIVPPLRRPGRLDQLLVYGAPTDAERKTVLEFYVKLYNIEDVFDSTVIDATVNATDGLSHAYLKELVVSIQITREIRTLEDRSLTPQDVKELVCAKVTGMTMLVKTTSFSDEGYMDLQEGIAKHFGIQKKRVGFV